MQFVSFVSLLFFEVYQIFRQFSFFGVFFLDPGASDVEGLGCGWLDFFFLERQCLRGGKLHFVHVTVGGYVRWNGIYFRRTYRFWILIIWILDLIWNLSFEIWIFIDRLYRLLMSVQISRLACLSGRQEPLGS